MRDVRVRKEPRLHFRPIDVGEELAELGGGFDDVVEGEGIIDFAVVGHGVDHVVFYQAGDGEAVFGVVF